MSAKGVSPTAGRRACALLVVGLVLSRADAFAVTVTRGPYIQNLTSSNAVLRWQTDSATESVVRYGGAVGSLTNALTNLAATVDHEMTLGALAPTSQYYYSVGNVAGPLAGDDSNHVVIVAPVPGAEGPVRIWAIGDSGTANASARAVRDAYLAESGGPAQVWLMLGDNAYDSGTEAEYDAAVFETYPTILSSVCLWSTRGNHEMSAAVYYGLFTMPTAGEAGGLASGTEAWYSFDYGNVHFVCLDSYASSRAVNGAMLTWLADDLAATTREWIVAFFHHPPYSKGSHDSDVEGRLVDMRQNAVPILEEYGVDLVLTGHSHSYERSYYVRGHTGLAATYDPAVHAVDAGDGREDGTGAYTTAITNGAAYVVCGSSGKISNGPLDHPVMYMSAVTLGSMLIDVDGIRMDIKFLDSAGGEPDHFTIIHHDPAWPVVANVGATNVTATTADLNGYLTATGSAPTEVILYWGTTNGGANTSQWEEAVHLPAGGVGPRTAALSNLAAEATYFCRFFATNSAGADWANTVISFTTPRTNPIIHSDGVVPGDPVAVTNIPVGATWKYHDLGVDLGTAWRATNYADGAWAAGPAELGYGDGGEATVVSYGPEATNKHPTTYFRHAFASPPGMTWTNSGVRLRRDDGAVLYLNGAEVLRDNMPGGVVLYTTLASSSVSGSDETAYDPHTLDTIPLAAATNTVAVEIHQRNATSSDISFDLEFVSYGAEDIVLGAANILSHAADLVGYLADAGSPPTVVWLFWGTTNGMDTASQWPFATSLGPRSAGLLEQTVGGLDPETDYYYRYAASNEYGLVWSSNSATFTTTEPLAPAIHSDGVFTGAALVATHVPAGATWKYFDLGADLGTAWQAVDYDDSAWASGPAELGYGDGDEATVVSYGPEATNKHPTTYFRHAFVAPADTTWTNAYVRLRRDDGAVVHLNGKELLRDNMPAGPILYSTFASSAIGGASESTYYEHSIGANGVGVGTNVVAVEVHQANATSSDISFDLSLVSHGDETFTLGATNILARSALLRGYLEDAGSPPADVWLFWGTSNGWEAASQWEFNVALGTGAAGRVSWTAASLEPATGYLYRYAASNVTGLVWSPSASAFVTAPSDTDGDGIDDDWEWLFFGSLTNAAVGTDADGDGFDDRGESVAGTNPTNAESLLWVESLAFSGSSNVVVGWSSVSGRMYRVYRSPSLIPAGWTPMATSVPGLGPSTSVTTSQEVGDSAYFRVSVEED